MERAILLFPRCIDEIAGATIAEPERPGISRNHERELTDLYAAESLHHTKYREITDWFDNLADEDRVSCLECPFRWRTDAQVGGRGGGDEKYD
ncbi:MAG: hypothetical protein WA208_10465 [Thermoanaerobaculia bacterium]